VYLEHPVAAKTELRGKLGVDHPSHLWSIHGKFYDMAEFLDKHPGGSDFLLACRGTDATELFESHHVNIKIASKILAKYEVKDMKPYNRELKMAKFEKNGFYDRVRSRVLSIYPKMNDRRQDSETSMVLYFSLLMAFIFNILSYSYTPAFTFPYIGIYIGCVFFNTVLGGFGHNFLHIAKSSWGCLLDWNGLSCSEWMIEHLVSHHMHTNTENDHDMISMNPIIYWTDGSKGGIGWLASVIVQSIIYAVAEVVVPLNGNLNHRFRHKHHLNVEYGRWFSLIWPARFLSFMLVHGVVAGGLGFVALTAGASIYFASFAHCTHMSTAALNAGKVFGELGQHEGSDWGLNQIATSKDIACPQLQFMRAFGCSTGFIKKMSSALCLGLDKQTMHHLFPPIDHSRMTDDVRLILKEELDAEYKLTPKGKSGDHIRELIEHCKDSIEPVALSELLYRSYRCAHAFGL